MANPIPKNYRSLTPYLHIRNAPAAIDFYVRALGATEISRLAGPDGAIAHAEIRVGDSMLMLGEENAQWQMHSPQSLGGTPVEMYLYVDNCDAVFNQAVAAGANAIMPPTDMFWGDRYAKLRDPFGHVWGIATHVEDLSPEEIARRGQEIMKQGCDAAQPAAPESESR